MTLRKGKIYVPMPQSEAYEGHVRDRLVEKYGEASVTRAEIAIMINIMERLGVIRQSEFVDFLIEILEKTELARRRQAGISD